jgi:hypothetical protein
MTVSADVVTAFNAIRSKSDSYTTLFNYYDGNQPLVYSTQRLREVFRDINAHFEQNWCAVVVDSVLERLSLKGLMVSGDEALNARMAELAWQSELTLESSDAHEASLVTGEAFVIAWMEADEPQAFYNDPRLCHIQYDAEFPRRKSWAAKMWTGRDKRLYLTLYYPDRLEYYASDKPAESVTSAEALTAIAEPAQNPTGDIPVFHLRRARRAIQSELTNVVTLQDGVNKLFADMMVAAEFGAFRQRYIIANSDTGQLKNAPNEIWSIPAGDGVGQGTSVGEFSATDLKNYLSAMESLAASIGIITRTPKHYFFSQGAVPSGEALIAMEAPLNKKAQRYIDRFSPVWESIGEFLLKLDGRAVPPHSVKAIFEKPETIQPKTRAEIVKANVDSGVPLATVLRDEGWSQDRLDKMAEDKQAEQVSGTAGLAQALLNRQRQFDRGNA